MLQCQARVTRDVRRFAEICGDAWGVWVCSDVPVKPGLGQKNRFSHWHWQENEEKNMLTDVIGHLLSSCTLLLLSVAWPVTPLRFNAFWLNPKIAIFWSLCLTPTEFSCKGQILQWFMAAWPITSPTGLACFVSATAFGKSYLHMGWKQVCRCFATNRILSTQRKWWQAEVSLLRGLDRCLKLIQQERWDG